jgi:hypothetical protein
MLLTAAWNAHVHRPHRTVESLSVFLSSVNYWRNPQRGVRRNVDIATVIACLGSEATRVDLSKPMALGCAVLGAACYGMARRERDADVASKWHCGMHACLNVAMLL